LLLIVKNQTVTIQHTVYAEAIKNTYALTFHLKLFRSLLNYFKITAEAKNKNIVPQPKPKKTNTSQKKIFFASLPFCAKTRPRSTNRQESALRRRNAPSGKSLAASAFCWWKTSLSTVRLPRPCGRRGLYR